MKVKPVCLDLAEGKVRCHQRTFIGRLAEPILGDLYIVGGKVWESGRRETYFVRQGGLLKRLRAFYTTAYMKLFPRIYKRRWAKRNGYN